MFRKDCDPLNGSLACGGVKADDRPDWDPEKARVIQQNDAAETDSGAVLNAVMMIQLPSIVVRFATYMAGAGFKEIAGNRIIAYLEGRVFAISREGANEKVLEEVVVAVEKMAVEAESAAAITAEDLARMSTTDLVDLSKGVYNIKSLLQCEYMGAAIEKFGERLSVPVERSISALTAFGQTAVRAIRLKPRN
jgi:hypothetical protein